MTEGSIAHAAPVERSWIENTTKTPHPAQFRSVNKSQNLLTSCAPNTNKKIKIIRIALQGP